MPPKVAVITGPTASGKTALGIALAQKFGGEIVSADSMQIYKNMDIGTAKPTPEELGQAVHHMVDIVSPFESYSVSRYVEDARAVVDDILSRGKLPIIVGGTGLYIDSLISNRDFAVEGNTDNARSEFSAMYDSIGGEAMLSRLSEFDPDSAKRLHANDKKRIIRAFEVYRLTGKTITEHDRETQLIPPRYDAVKIALSFKEREDLYARIDKRVDIMVETGLEDEVRSLLSSGLTASHTSMQAIGYKEFTEYFEGKLQLAEVVDIIKMESRRYAKRQLSWLRRDKSVKWILWDKIPDFESGVLNSTKFLTDFGIIEPYK